MSSPRDQSCGNTEQLARSRLAAPLFSPFGSQSTHGSSVGMRTPSLLPPRSVGLYGRSYGESTPRLGSLSPAPGSGLASRFRATKRFLQARADALRSPGMSSGGQGQPQSAQPGPVHPSYLLSTPSKPWLDVTNVQPPFRGEAGLLADSKPTRDSYESSTPSLSVPDIQCREVGPHLPLTTGIQGGIEIPRAKAVAAVVSPHIIHPQGNPLVTTGIQTDTVALPSKESTISSLSVAGIQRREEPPSSVVVHISQPTIGIQRGRVTSSDIQSGPVSHQPTPPFLPTTDSHFDLPPLSGRRGG